MSLEPMHPLIDIGVNLTHRQFAKDRTSVIERARAAGVVQQVVTGTSVVASNAAVLLARDHAGELWATAGIHPHNASEYDERALASLRALLAERGPAHERLVVAVGECGLDYDRDFSPREAQRRCFAAQLALAAECQKPVFLHERAAHADFRSILAEHRSSLVGAVVHCFTGTPVELESYLELGCHVGITGYLLDDRRAGELVQAVRRLPLERLMLETDAPFLLPPSAKKSHGRRNEPALLPMVLDGVARVTGHDRGAVARATTENAQQFFGLRRSVAEP